MASSVKSTTGTPKPAAKPFAGAMRCARSGGGGGDASNIGTGSFRIASAANPPAARYSMNQASVSLDG
jgi:hypothetical protein